MCDASVCDATVRGSHGLSTRRARKTKSRRLEVGARRAPKLLVYIYLRQADAKLKPIFDQSEPCCILAFAKR